MTLSTLLEKTWAGLRRRHRLGTIYSVQSTEEVPDKIGKAVYLVGLPKTKWVVFSCPCGCGEKLSVNLMYSIYPHWQLRLEKGTISLRPSVWIDNKGCNSHFWIDKNRVIWVYGDRNMTLYEWDKESP
jgi:hypothetical protein